MRNYAQQNHKARPCPLKGSSTKTSAKGSCDPKDLLLGGEVPFKYKNNRGVGLFPHVRIRRRPCRFLSSTNTDVRAPPPPLKYRRGACLPRDSSRVAYPAYSRVMSTYRLVCSLNRGAPKMLVSFLPGFLPLPPTLIGNAKLISFANLKAPKSPPPILNRSST